MKDLTRRAFGSLGLILWPLAYGVALAAGAARYLSPLPPPLRKARLDVCALDELDGGAVKRVDDFNGRSIYVLRNEGEVLALDAQCTHLACNVNWSEKDACFLCPCHGGRFARGGTATRMPPIGSLRRQKLAVVDGRVILLDDPASMGAEA
jgi:cytochrome b6-f complex iron-sulfur subunit